MQDRKKESSTTYGAWFINKITEHQDIFTICKGLVNLVLHSPASTKYMIQLKMQSAASMPPQPQVILYTTIVLRGNGQGIWIRCGFVHGGIRASMIITVVNNGF